MSTNRFITCAAMLVVALSVGCGDDDDGDTDSGTRPDSGAIDSGATDGGEDGDGGDTDGGGTDGGDTDGGGTDGGDTDAGGADAGEAATFTMIYDEILDPRCATAGCHAPPTPTGSMNLGTRGMAYAALVGVDAMGPACGPTDLVRVVPGDAAMSLLFLKVSEATPPCGARMPLVGAPLTDAEQAMIEAWIEAGAMND